MRILVIQDEPPMAAYICNALLEESFVVDCAHDGRTALDLALTREYDVILLDRMLPGIDGLTVCRRLREAGQRTPILILSARGLADDRVMGLNAGADDYLVKPFATEELIARVRTLVRPRQVTAPPIVRVGTLELDPATRTVRRNGEPVTLTQKEYALLEYLMRRPGAILTRAMIVQHVWEYTFDLGSNVVDVYIKHLRDKIDDPGHPSFIQTVRGVGYTFRDPAAIAT